MTTLEELKKKRSLQRETEAAARAAREKKAKEGSESSRKAKALLKQPRKLAMIFGGVVLAVGLLQGLMLGGFYLLAQSRLNTYYESVEIGDFETAAEALSGYLAHNSDDWQLQAEYAVLLLKLDRAEEAEVIFLDIREQSPGSFSTDMQFYAALSNFKFKNTLVEGLEAVLESVPNFLPAQLGMGVIALDSDPAEALVLFSQAKDRLAEMSTGSDIYQRSQSQVNSFVNIACATVPDIFNHVNDDPAAKNQRGAEPPEMFKFSYGVLSDSDQYIYGLDNSLFFNFCGLTRKRIDDENWKNADLRALFNMLHGYAHAVAGDYASAREALANSRAHLELPESIFLEGIVALSEYNYQLAEDSLTPLRQSDDQAAMLALAHAILHQNPEKWPAAKGLLGRAIEGNLEMAAVALNNRGVLSLVDNLPGQARNDFNSALKNRTGYPHAQFNTAVANLADGKCSAALTKFDELYTEGLVFPGIRYYSAICYKEAGQTSQAQSDLRYAVKDPYFNAYAHAALGDIFSEKELFTDQATQNYFTAHSLQPENYEVGFKLAESMSRGGQPVAASNLIDNIIEEVGEKHAQDVKYQVLRDAAIGQVKYELGEEDALQYLTDAYSVADDTALKVRLAVQYSNLLIKEGEISKADAVTREILALVPENTRVLIARARVLLASRNIGQAVEMVRTALTRDKGNFDLQMTAGEVLEAAGEIDAALEAYRSAHEIEPSNVSPLNRQLAVLQEHQPSSSRIQEVEALIKNNQRLAASTGSSRQVQQGASKDQRTIAPGSLIRDPEGKARTQEQIEKISADIENQIIDKYTGYQNRAALHFQLGEYESALADFKLASDISPDAALPWKNIASLHLQRGNYQEATNAYQRAIDLDSEDTRIYYAWAQARSFYVGSEQSILDFTRVLEKDPLNANAYVSRGRALIDVEQYEQAINDFTQALQYDAQSICAYQLRSKVYTLIGQIEKASNDSDTLNVLRGGDVRVQGLQC